MIKFTTKNLTYLPVLVFRDFGVAAKDLHKGTQCSIAFNKSCSQRRSTSSRTDRFFSGNNRQSKSREPGGTTPLVPSDTCKVAAEFSSGRAVSSFAKNILDNLYHSNNWKYQFTYCQETWMWEQSYQI